MLMPQPKSHRIIRNHSSAPNTTLLFYFPTQDAEDTDDIDAENYPVGIIENHPLMDEENERTMLLGQSVQTHPHPMAAGSQQHHGNEFYYQNPTDRSAHSRISLSIYQSISLICVGTHSLYQCLFFVLYFVAFEYLLVLVFNRNSFVVNSYPPHL